MGTVVCCPNCGHVHYVIISDAGYVARFGGERVLGYAIQPAVPVPLWSAAVPGGSGGAAVRSVWGEQGQPTPQRFVVPYLLCLRLRRRMRSHKSHFTKLGFPLITYPAVFGVEFAPCEDVVAFVRSCDVWSVLAGFAANEPKFRVGPGSEKISLGACSYYMPFRMR